MRSIRIRNLRSLADTGDIEIKPLTLLVGANSSGKSTFLRAFPMLRQSAETQTGSGLLLNEPYVDYGVFPVALRKDADPKEIILDFAINFEPHSGGRSTAFMLGHLPVKLSVHFAQRSQAELYSFVSQVEIVLGDDNWKDFIVFDVSEDGRVTSLKINEYSANSEATKLKVRAGRGIVPLLVLSRDSNEADSVFVRDETAPTSAFTESLLNATAGIFHGRTLRATRLNIFQAVKIGSPEAMLKQMAGITDNGNWNQAMRAWSPTTPRYVQLRNCLIGSKLPNLLTAFGWAMAEYSRSVHYFEPVRARVQRDYMSRDVQVESVEPDGKNVAMFLTSLRSDARKSFQDWLLRYFGLMVYPQAVGDGARVSLRLRESHSGAEFNLADMGFGYSQMLPLLVQIWALTEQENFPRNFRRNTVGWGWARERFSAGYIVAIEQPELHLHPALQARVAELFVNTLIATRELNMPIRFVIETHSQTIINRIGQLVEAKQVSTKDVQVLLFERGGKGADPLVSRIRHSEFDDSGVLKNWPFGFFLPNVRGLDVFE